MQITTGAPSGAVAATRPNVTTSVFASAPIAAVPQLAAPVFAALAVSRWIEARTGWSIRRFVKTARRYRTIQIQAGQHTVTAANPLPDDLRQALSAMNAPAEIHTNLS